MTAYPSYFLIDSTFQWSQKILQDGQKGCPARPQEARRLRRTRGYVAGRRATEKAAAEKRILVRWGRAGKIDAFFTILLVGHLVVVKPEMMPDLVHDRVAHFLHHFFPGVAKSEDRPAIDRDFGRQLSACLEE